MAKMNKIKFLSDVEIDGELTVKGGNLNATPDWSQSDETAPDYIKNRTHYEGKKIKEELVLENIDFEATEYDDGYPLSPFEYAIPEGENYSKYIQDGATVILWETKDGERRYEGTFSGNSAEIVPNYDTFYEDKATFYFDKEKNVLGFDYGPAAGSYTCSFDKVIITNEHPELKQLDEKFIPDTVARMTDITTTKKELLNKFKEIPDILDLAELDYSGRFLSPSELNDDEQVRDWVYEASSNGNLFLLNIYTKLKGKAHCPVVKIPSSETNIFKLCPIAYVNHEECTTKIDLSENNWLQITEMCHYVEGEYITADTSSISLIPKTTPGTSSTTVDLPIAKGTGKNSIILNEGVAKGEGSIAGGSTDKSVLESVIGVAASLVDTTPAEALSAMSLAFGANTKSITAGSSAIGFGNQGGVKGYYWDTIDFSTNTIKLSSTRRASSLINPTYVTNFDWHEGDIISMVNKNNYFARSVITAVDIDNSTITVDTLPFSEIQYDTIASLYTYTKPYDRTIYAVYQNSEDVIDTGNPRWVPRNGTVEIGFGSYTLGVMNLSTGNAAFNTGFNNWAGGAFSFTTGRDNMAGYAAMAGGVQSKAYAYASLAYGLGVITKCSAGTTLGQYNSLNNLENYLLVVGNGSSNTDRSNAFSVDKSGNVKVAGDIYNKDGKVITESSLTNYAKLTDVNSRLERFENIEDTFAHSFTQDFSVVPSNWNNGEEGSNNYITNSSIASMDLTNLCGNTINGMIRGGASTEILEFTNYLNKSAFHFASKTSSSVRYKLFNSITTKDYLTEDDIGKKVKIDLQYVVITGTLSCGVMSAIGTYGTNFYKRFLTAGTTPEAAWREFSTVITIDETMVNNGAGLLTLNLDANSEVYVTNIRCIGLNTLQTVMNHALKQADWNQYDENASDYIKNRTHYEIDAEEIITLNVAMSSDTEGEGYHNSNYTGYFDTDLGADLDSLIGTEFTVTINGSTTYSAVLEYGLYDGEHPVYYLGDWMSYLDGGEWNFGAQIEEDYLFVCLHDFYDNNITDINVSLSYSQSRKELKQLDDKFIPDTIVRKKDLGENLFDGNYVEGVDIGGAVGSLQYKITTAASRCSTIIMEVEPNTTYSLIKEKTGREGTASGAYYYFKLATATKLMTTDKEKFDGDVQHSITDKPTTNITFTTGPNDKYLYVMTSTNLKPFVQIVKDEQTEFTVSDYSTVNNKNKKGLTFCKWFDRAPRSSATPSASNCVPHMVIVDGKNTYHFAKDVDTSLNLNTWRWIGHKINGDVLWDKNEEALLWSVSDSEGVIKEAGADDFIGGYHGNELCTGITILVDGELINESSFAMRRNCSNITLIVSSDVYSYGTSNVIFKRHKKLEFTDNKVKVSNTWNYVGADSLSIHTDLLSGLYSVYKRNLVGLSDSATNSFVATQTSNNDSFIVERDSNLTEATFYGNNYSVTVKTTGKLPDTYYGSVKDFGAQNRYKVYLYNSVNEKTIAPGDILRGSFEIEIH